MNFFSSYLSALLSFYNFFFFFIFILLWLAICDRKSKMRTKTESIIHLMTANCARTFNGVQVVRAISNYIRFKINKLFYLVFLSATNLITRIFFCHQDYTWTLLNEKTENSLKLLEDFFLQWIKKLRNLSGVGIIRDSPVFKKKPRLHTYIDIIPTRHKTQTLFLQNKASVFSVAFLLSTPRRWVWNTKHSEHEKSNEHSHITHIFYIIIICFFHHAFNSTFSLVKWFKKIFFNFIFDNQ